jgi:hypothetical protein
LEARETYAPTTYIIADFITVNFAVFTIILQMMIIKRCPGTVYFINTTTRAKWLTEFATS